MKFDYSIKWYELAENKLLRQAQYILEQSQNVVIAENFYDAIKSEVDKLSFTADVYRLRKKKEIPIPVSYTHLDVYKRQSPFLTENIL